MPSDTGHEHPEKQRCQAACRNGTACLNRALPHADVCWLHARLAQRPEQRNKKPAATIEPIKQVAKIIIHNPHNEYLLHLRDDNPRIAFPLHWNLLGGVVEKGETPEEAIRREVREEIGIDIRKPSLFLVRDHQRTRQYIFSACLQLDPAKLKLTEGIAVRWFKAIELPSLNIGFNYRDVILAFVHGARNHPGSRKG